jgi:hypothetical protein
MKPNLLPLQISNKFKNWQTPARSTYTWEKQSTRPPSRTEAYDLIYLILQCTHSPWFCRILQAFFTLLSLRLTFCMLRTRYLAQKNWHFWTEFSSCLISKRKVPTVSITDKANYLCLSTSYMSTLHWDCLNKWTLTERILPRKALTEGDSPIY